MQFSDALLAWYDAEARALPWRGERDPYRIWLSEIMLQQTRTETVRAYYLRFLEAFPDVNALAAAPEDRVLKLWEGLGYYSRARNLLRAARIVSEEMSGRFPDTPEGLRALPGIGPYAANAIASIAFGACVPALDGNQARVISRLTAWPRVIRTPFDLEQPAMRLISRDRPGDYNQALMDLGASICTPKSPACERCPGALWCQACARGEVLNYPIRPRPPAKREVPLTVLLIRVGGGFAVYRRPEDGLLGGLYAFPTAEGHPSPEALEEQMRSEGWEAAKYIHALPEGSHTFTHLIWRMRGALMSATRAPDGFIVTDAPRSLAFPTALRTYLRIAEALLKGDCGADSQPTNQSTGGRGI